MSDPYYRMFPREWDDGTAPLTLEQEGALLRICNAINSRRAPLPDDEEGDREMMHRCRVSMRKWRALKAALVKAEKITIEDGMICQSRALSEVGYRLEKEDVNSENSSKAARKRAENRAKTARKPAETQDENKENNDIPLAIPEPSPALKKEAKASSPKPRGKRNSYPDDFEAFWKAYPVTTGNSKPKAGEQWAKLDDDDRLAAMRSLPVYRAHLTKTDQSCKHAERFLRDRRFETLQPASISQIAVEPVDLPESPEGRFMLAAREAGVSEVRIRSWLGRFNIERFGEQWACVVASREQEFQEWFAEPIKSKGLVVYPESYAAKRRAA